MHKERFEVHISDEVLADLGERLRRTRWPGDFNNEGWAYGTLEGLPLHFIHEPGKGPRPLPLILTHGWPWTFWGEDIRAFFRPLRTGSPT